MKIKTLIITLAIGLQSIVGFSQDYYLHCGSILDVQTGKEIKTATIVVSKNKITKITDGFIAKSNVNDIEIDLKNIIEPKTENHLVIEGAGGVFVPLNKTDCIIDLIQPDYKVIVVSRHYLGSINHTLLTIEAIKNRGFTIAGIIFNGNENKATESLILNYSKLKFIGRINDEPYFDKNVISEYADLFRDNLMAIE